jgi:superfamily I DNA/RNA helicase
VKAYDKHRRDKGKPDYTSPDGPPIHVHSVASDKAEAAAVSNVIRDALPSRDVLVLVPKRKNAELIAERLRRARIPYVAPEPLPGSGLPLLERLATWLRDEKDNLALRECIEAMINSSWSPVPSKLVRKAEKKAQRDKEYQQISNLWQTAFKNGCSLWDALVAADDPQTKLVCCMKRQCNRLRLRYKQDNVAGLLRRAALSLEPWRKSAELLEEVETWVSRLAESPAAGSGAQVRIMTFQGAKGLEADVVCVVGLEQGTLPRDKIGGEELAEQSRLMYVSMTRARTDLHLFHARTRSGAVSFKQIHGKDGPHTLQHSCFLDAIPKNYRHDEYHPAMKQ